MRGENVKTIEISIVSTSTLSIDEVWPDGDAPDNPTVEDVIKAMRPSGGVGEMASDWNLGLWADVRVIGSDGKATSRGTWKGW